MIPRLALGWTALGVLIGCATRERLTFPSETGDGVGPTTEFTRPGAPDTVVIEGDLLIVQGRSFDPDGVDTIYISIGGVNQAFAPILGHGKDTVDFSVQLSTINNSGATVIVEVFGVDLFGDHGTTVSRQIHIE
jgi:hypothetical protein